MCSPHLQLINATVTGSPERTMTDELLYTHAGNGAAREHIRPNEQPETAIKSLLREML